MLLISCGSFNPVTFTHLRLFEIARDVLKRDKGIDILRGIISPVHDAYGKKGLVSSNHRVSMAKLATETSDWVKVDDWESKQPGWSRTLTVLKHAKECLINRISPYNLDYAIDPSEVSVKLLCGGDLLESFATPGLWQDADIKSIVVDYGIVVIMRPGSNPEQFVQSKEVLFKNKNNIDIIEESVPSDMSATRIREKLGKKESVRYLTFDRVIDYIKDHGLYSNTQ